MTTEQTSSATEGIFKRRRVSSDNIGTDADKSMVHVSKDIIDSPQLKAIEKCDGELRRYLKDRCLPSHFKSVLGTDVDLVTGLGEEERDR